MSFDAFLAAVRDKDYNLAESELRNMDHGVLAALDGYLGRCRSRVAYEITHRAVTDRKKK